MIEHEIIDLIEAMFELIYNNLYYIEGIRLMNVNSELMLSHNLSLMNKYLLILSRYDNRCYRREVLNEVLEVLESDHFVVNIQYHININHMNMKKMMKGLLINQ